MSKLAFDKQSAKWISKLSYQLCISSGNCEVTYIHQFGYND